MSGTQSKMTRTEFVPERSYGRSLPMLLMRGRESVMRRIRPHLRAHDLTDQQWRIVRALAVDERMELTELSQRSLIQPPSLTRTVQALTDRGLIRREVHRTDRRRTLVSLTDAGRALFDDVSVGSAQIYDQIRRDVGEAKVDELYERLIEMIDVLDATFDSPDEPTTDS